MIRDTTHSLHEGLDNAKEIDRLFQYLARKVQARITRDQGLIKRIVEEASRLVNLCGDELFVKDAALEVRNSPRLGFYVLVSSCSLNTSRVYKLNVFPVDLKTGSIITTNVVDQIFNLNSHGLYFETIVSESSHGFRFEGIKSVATDEGNIVLPDGDVINSLRRTMKSPRLEMLLKHEDVYAYIIEALNNDGITAYFDPLDDYKLITGPGILYESNSVRINLEFEPSMKRLKATAIRGDMRGNLRMLFDRPIVFDFEGRSVEDVAQDVLSLVNGFNKTLLFHVFNEAEKLEAILNKHSKGWKLYVVDLLMSIVSFNRGPMEIKAFFGPGYIYNVSRPSSVYIRVRRAGNDLRPLLERLEFALGSRLPSEFQSRFEMENGHTLAVDISPKPGRITIPADLVGKRNVFLDYIVHPVWKAFSEAIGEVL